jgi:peptidoglycan/LPS O-acetylase OafA/YrhL
LVRKAANVEQLASVDRASNVLGKLSYPLYAVHYPIVRAIGFVVLRHPMPLIAQLGIVGLSVAVITMAAWIMSRFYDEPVRRALTRRLLPVTAVSRPAICVSVQH